FNTFESSSTFIKSPTMFFPIFDSPSFSHYEEPLLVLIDDLPNKRRCPASRFPQVTQKPTQKVAQREVNEPTKIALHIGNFKPEDIKVSLSGRLLTVEGSQSSSSDSSTFSSSFKRTITLNDQIDPSTVYSKITQDGTLEIGANPRPIDRQIEITVEKPKEGDVPTLSVDAPILEAVGPDMDSDQ
ncbi:hypothetical protein PFISCL1PPCAC_11413, partial [Pristionchus fissidentatus]